MSCILLGLVLKASSVRKLLERWIILSRSSNKDRLSMFASGREQSLIFFRSLDVLKVYR